MTVHPESSDSPSPGDVRGSSARGQRGSDAVTTARSALVTTTGVAATVIGPEIETVDPDDELIVAYLDGELADDERPAVERRLVDDAAFRARLRDLDQGWALLDELPDPAPTRDLVTSTMEMAVIDATQAIQTVGHSRSRRGFKALGWLALSILAGGLVIAVYGQWQLRNELRSVPIVRHLDAYLYAGDLNLMRRLAAHPKWKDYVEVLPATDKLSVDETDFWNLTPSSFDQWTAAADESAASRLNQQLRRWEGLDPELRRRASRVSEIVREQTDRDSLLQTMEAYWRFREQLSPELRRELEAAAASASSGDDESVDEVIDRAIAESMTRFRRQSGGWISDDSIDAIIASLRSIIDARRQSGDRGIVELYRRIERMPNIQDPFFAIMFGFVRDSSPFQRRPGFSRDTSRTLSLTDAEYWQIYAAITDEDAEQLNRLVGDDDDAFFWILDQWIVEALRRRSPLRDDRDDLTRYNELPSERRELLDLSNPEKFFEELSRSGRFGR